MLRKMLILSTFLLLVSSSIFSSISHFDDRFKGLSLNSAWLFNGDKHGDFKNDLVAILNDGSAWKVHPKDQDLFSQWSFGDTIRIRVRTSFYWFKREHKFELCNETHQTTVRAMLVQYSEIPLSIVKCQTHISGYHMGVYTTTDMYGNVHYHYYPIYTYATTIQLNDASQWNIDEYCYYESGEKAYIFLDRESNAFILITGIEREAQWKEILLKSI